MTEFHPESEVEAAWNLATPMSGRDPAVYRIAPDIIRSVIRRDRYNVRGEFGWRIQYGWPVAYRDITTASAIQQLSRDSAAVRERQERAGAAGPRR